MNQEKSPPKLKNVDASLLVMRVIVGSIFFAHGAQKLFKWFDGQGLDGLIAAHGHLLAYLVAIGECLGGIGIIIGLLARFSAAADIVIMIGAIAMVHGKAGFFMSAGGYEYNLALIGLLLPIVLIGPGRYSIGRFLPLPKQTGTDRPIIALE